MKNDGVDCKELLVARSYEGSRKICG